MIVVRNVLYRALRLYDPAKPRYNCYEAAEGGVFDTTVQVWPCTLRRARLPGLKSPVSVNVKRLGQVVKWSGK